MLNNNNYNRKKARPTVQKKYRLNPIFGAIQNGIDYLSRIVFRSDSDIVSSIQTWMWLRLVNVFNVFYTMRRIFMGFGLHEYIDNDVYTGYQETGYQKGWNTFISQYHYLKSLVQFCNSFYVKHQAIWITYTPLFFETYSLLFCYDPTYRLWMFFNIGITLLAMFSSIFNIKQIEIIVCTIFGFDADTFDFKYFVRMCGIASILIGIVFCTNSLYNLAVIDTCVSIHILNRTHKNVMRFIKLNH